MVLELLDQLSSPAKVCCEIGANDGLELSNTAALWRDRGWHAVLCEANANPAYGETHALDALRENTTGYDTLVVDVAATPANINDIVPSGCTVLSIDIDGDDYYLMEALHEAPGVLVIEYNPTVPYWVDVVGEPGSIYGASPAALIRVALTKGLHLAGATGCNLVFTSSEEVAERYDTDLERIIGRADLTYATTDYKGHMRPIGPLCFGLVNDAP